MEAYKDAFRNYFNWQGRTRRAGYWFFLLVNLIVVGLLRIIDRWVAVKYLGFSTEEAHETGIYTLSVLYSLIVAIPGIMLSIRRLHDTDRSGWWLLLNFIPLIGALILLVFYCQSSKPDNRFGAAPYPQLTTRPS